MIFSQQLIRIKFGLGLITLSTSLLELCLIRVLDVILNPVMGYMVITTSMFALGLGGIYVFIFKNKIKDQIRLLPTLTVLFAFLVVFLLPAFNWLPFNLDFEGASLMIQILSWTGMYLTLTAPFFIGGIIISIIFSNYSSESHGLYFFDLSGAGTGCLLLVPLIPHYGPGGLLFFIFGLLIISASLFTTLKIRNLYYIIPVVTAIVLFPLTLDSYLDFRGHGNKRGVDEWITQGLREYVRWDPVSKLDVFNVSPRAKHFSLDGGQQGSWLQHFDGNYDTYLKRIADQPDNYYFGISSAVHHFYQGKNADVLIIGAAVGSETKSALIFGADHVDAIDLVKTMVDAVKTRYAQFSGNVFVHPKVNYYAGEGRTFLRSSGKKYDIIQMYSNHTSSSLAHGSGVLSSVYLQTAEAYMEYFEHLKEDGILQINHHLYPKMIITAALGWERLGRTDFPKHVLVLERWIPDNLPTLLIKMKPWTKEEVDRIQNYMNREKTGQLQNMPTHIIPSEKIYEKNPYQATFTSGVDEIKGISIMIGTHDQGQLDYPVTMKLFDSEGKTINFNTIPKGTIRNNTVVDFQIPPISNCQNRIFRFEISADNPHPDKGFSIWLTRNKMPVIQTIPRPPMPAYHAAYHPLELDKNLIPAVFLRQPFPKDLAKTADYTMNPVTDDKPQFNMIRKSNKRLEAEKSKYLDGGTAYFLNNQLRRFLPYDWISIFVVGTISILFSLVFIIIPLLSSSLGRTRWKGMSAYLIYFSCLGAGFIIIELTFIQIFTKLIGFPTHTFATVIFSLLFAAGIGSMSSKKANLHTGGRWKIIFIGILIYGFILIMLYPYFFSIFLGSNLPARIFVAMALIFPLGFFMGMPFPLGMLSLGEVEPKGIPWAWGMNGFFTVFGGYLGLLISMWVGFRIVLFFALGIYFLAFFLFGLIKHVRATVTS